MAVFPTSYRRRSRRWIGALFSANGGGHGRSDGAPQYAVARERSDKATPRISSSSCPTSGGDTPSGVWAIPMCTRRTSTSSRLRACSSGRRFANTPVCCPARATILTGTYTSRNGMLANDLRLKEDLTTLADLYGHAGYRTGFIGKWHLGRGATSAGVCAARPATPWLPILGRS